VNSKCFENLANPLCGKVMPVFELTQTLSTCIIRSIWLRNIRWGSWMLFAKLLIKFLWSFMQQWRPMKKVIIAPCNFDRMSTCFISISFQQKVFFFNQKTSKFSHFRRQNSLLSYFTFLQSFNLKKVIERKKFFLGMSAINIFTEVVNSYVKKVACHH
jgi:hypothetical protein